MDPVSTVTGHSAVPISLKLAGSMLHSSQGRIYAEENGYKFISHFYHATLVIYTHIFIRRKTVAHNIYI